MKTAPARPGAVTQHRTIVPQPGHREDPLLEPEPVTGPQRSPWPAAATHRCAAPLTTMQGPGQHRWHEAVLPTGDLSCGWELVRARAGCGRCCAQLPGHGADWQPFEDDKLGDGVQVDVGPGSRPGRARWTQQVAGGCQVSGSAMLKLARSREAWLLTRALSIGAGSDTWPCLSAAAQMILDGRPERASA
jgi:hypothetical protein